MNQIERIVEVTGMPSKPDVDAIQSPYAATMLESLPPMQYKSIPEVFPSAGTEGVDFIKECLHMNPDKRKGTSQLLQHVFVAEFHNEEEEPVYPHGPLRHVYRILLLA